VRVQLSTFTLILLAGLALGGCAVGPDYKKTEPDSPKGWSRLDAAAEPVTSAGAPGDLSQWWRGLNDPLLTELIEQAMHSSLDLRQAQARLREARARRDVAEGGQWPSVSASGSASLGRSGMIPGAGSAGDRFSTSFDASWELDVFGGKRREVEAAGADLESTAASLDGTRVSLAGEVARSYVEVRALQVRLGLARSNLASQAETLQLTGWRAQAGLVSEQDVEQARSNHEATLALLPSLEISLAESEHRLDILLGQSPGTLHARLAAGGELPALPARIAVGIPADTLRQRPDVRAAERKLAAETARVGVAVAARYPSFRLSGSIGAEALVRGTTGNGGGILYSLVGGLTAPLFDAGRLRGQQEMQDAVREQAQVAYEAAVLTALQEVENALVSLAQNRDRAETLERAAEAARKAAELARQRYTAGVIDFQSVLDTQRSVLSLEDSLASTRADEVLALVRLYKALGGGWSPPAEPGPAGEDTP